MADRLPHTDPLPADAIALHIGIHKTGTTALQAALADARPELAAHGVLYPGRRTAQHGAAMAVLGEQLYSTLFTGLSRGGGYTQAGLLGAALFLTAGLVYLMARRIHASEALARRRGIDIANLASLNTHIVQRLQAGILVTDHRQHIRLINDTACKLLGIHKDSEGRALADDLR